jgi:predicted ribosome quality control (RQC) complex YloA/Tae2 family protein
MDIEQYEFERVVVLKLKTQEGEMQLILELFGDGNIILVGENGKILQALIYKRMRDRNIVRDETFTFAPSAGKNPMKVSKEEFSEGLRKFGDVEVVRAFSRFLSVGGVNAEEALTRANVDKTRHCSTLSDDEINAIFDALQSLLLQVVNGALEPRLVLDETGGFFDVVPIRLKRYESSSFKFQPFPSFNEALDEFYVKVTAVEKALAGIEVDQLRREAERLKRIITDQEKTLVEGEADADKNRLIGDTIYAHSTQMQALLDKFSTAKQNGKDWNAATSEILEEKKTGAEPSIFFESFESRGAIVNVCVNSLRFGLNLRKNMFENAAEYYERGKRIKQKLAGAKKALKETQKKLVEIEAKMAEAHVLESIKPTEAVEELSLHKVKSKEWFEKFRWFISSDGFLVVAGKDAVSNEVLIKKHTETDDVVFHADITGAPFAVVKTKGKEPSERCLRETGEFAAAFSRGWREGFGSVDVYWVKPEQLSKSGPSGEFVARGAFVVSGKRNWMRNVPLKLSVGAVVDEKTGDMSFIGGPVDAVKAKTQAYVVVVPGDVKGKELLGRVLRALGGKASRELRDTVIRASVEDVREFVPFGTGRVLDVSE